MLSDAAHAYLAAFDAYLQVHRLERDDLFVSDLKTEALEHLVASRGLDPAAFIRDVPREPRGAQNTPRSSEKRRARRARRRAS